MQCGTHVRPLGPFNSTYLSFHFFLLHFFFAYFFLPLISLTSDFS